MKIDTFPRFFFGFWQHEKLPPFGKFRRPAEIFYFVTQAPHAVYCLGYNVRNDSCFSISAGYSVHRASARPLRALLPLASHAAVSNPSIYRNIAKGKSCYNTICDRRFFDANRHSAKSRPSLRMEQALRFGRWDSICCGKQPLNILEVVGLRAPTAVETCHRHVSKSRLSNPTFGAKNKDHPNGWSLFWRRPCWTAARPPLWSTAAARSPARLHFPRMRKAVICRMPSW